MPSDCTIDPTEIWLSALAAQGRSPATITSYRRQLGKLAAWRQADPDLTTLTRLEAMAFVRHMGEHHRPGGVAIAVRSLKACWSWMVAEGLVAENVFTRLRVSIPDEAQHTATDDEIERMLTSAKRSKRDLAVLTVLVDTGARRGEVAHVEMADLDLPSGVIRFRVSKTRARTVPLTDRAIVALGRWLRYRGVGSGSVWSVSDPYSLVNAAVLRHSKGTMRSHALRRAFAVRWLERGGSEIGLMRIAGWASLAMIKRYTAAHADVLAADEMRRLFA